MLGDELEELLDVGRAGLKKSSVVDMHNHHFKVFILLLPLQDLLRLLVVAEVLEEDEDCQVLKVALLRD